MNLKIISFCNHPYREIALNWVKHLEELSIDNYEVLCLDAESDQYLKSHGCHSRVLNEFNDDWISGCKHTMRRTFIFKKYLEEGFNIIHSDTDALWLKNPIPNLIESKKIPALKTVDNVIGANFLFDVKKMKKIKFFDEQFFLYWEDVDLCFRIKKRRYKMIIVRKAKAKHLSSKSSINNLKTFFIRNINFKFGEYLYYYKIKKFKTTKPLRQISTNLFYFLINLISFNFLKCLRNIAYILGIFKFIFR